MIYLIRHGQTEANIKHIYCGSTDLPLSAAGVDKLRERRKKSTIDDLRARIINRDEKLCFVTSGMKRTEQTLELLFGDVEHTVDSRFREIDFGIFEMRSYYDLKDTPEYQEWISDDNETNVCPGGESGRQMEARVMEAFDGLREQFLKSVNSDFAADNISVAAGTDVPERATDVVVVTHGGVIAAIMNNLFPEEDKTRFEWQPAPGCGYVVVNEHEYIKI